MRLRSNIANAAMLALCGATILGIASNARAVVSELKSTGFESNALGALNDDGGVDKWSSYGDGGLRMTVTDVVAHGGVHSITNTQTFPTGYTNLYQYGVAESVAEIQGKTIAWSFYTYYDPTTFGNDVTADTFNYLFDTRNTLNVKEVSVTANVAASALTPNAWTKFSGSYRVPPVPTTSPPPTLLAAVIQAPHGTFYWDDFATGAVFDGDADLDGDVDIVDFNILAVNFGAQTGQVFTTGDFDYDGAVGITDFNLLAVNFGKTSVSGDSAADASALMAFAAAHGDLATFEALTGVPEPTSLALGAGGAMLALRRRRA